MEDSESDRIVEQWVLENDDTFMPLPAIETSPHLLISKVRKHYMEYLIKLLSENYEFNQKLHNKNVYLPSAIWRCAKIVEMSAAQASMVVQLYRKNIMNVVKDLKNKTKEGLLYKKLYDCLHNAPVNEKKIQTTFGKTSNCKCKCYCIQGKSKENLGSPKNAFSKTNNDIYITNLNNVFSSTNLVSVSTSYNSKSEITLDTLNNIKCDYQKKENDKVTAELENSDELMQQLEKLFQDDPNDEDLFDGALCEADNSKVLGENVQLFQTDNKPENPCILMTELEIKKTTKPHLDDRLALFSGGLVKNSSEMLSQDFGSKKSKKRHASKWLCEEYFQKAKLYELLDQIRDCDRDKLEKIKEMLKDLFGEDSDDESVLSPLEENSEFVISCKERIAPWVIKILTPYYVKGRIRGKTLFKSLAKHLIRLIYQCSKFPYEYEVQSFVYDFLNSHKMIRCEADFKQFRIENI